MEEEISVENSMDNKEIENIVREVLEKAVGSKSGANPASWNTADKAGRTLAGEGDAEAASRKTAGERDAGTTLPKPGAAGPQKGGLVAANGGLVRTSMTLALAVKLIEKIEAKAAEWGMRVVTAVSDASGRPVAIHCMDGAYVGSFDVALNKTYTSIAFQMSTAQLGELSQPGKSLYGIQFTNEGRIVIFGGGEILKRDGVIIGALGVSGGSAEQDTQLAAYGKSIFEEVIACL